MNAIDSMNLYQLQEEQRALEVMIQRTSLGMARGDWLISQFGPDGPIMRDHDVSYCHKVTWGLFEDARLEGRRVLDWLQANARQGVAQYYFPEEPPFNREAQRVYRFLTFAKIAEALHHPAMANDETREETCTYLHESGGCFGHPSDPSLRQSVNPLVTSFLTEWALPAGLAEPAKKSGDFLAMMVDLNREHMLAQPVGRFYYVYDVKTGKLVTDVPPGEDLNYFVDTVGAKQHFYYMGCSMAALADLYLAGLGDRYLEAAKVLADFTERCNPEGLRWPSYCKVGWGAAELYAATGDPRHRVMASNVSDITFIGAQTAAGGWENMYYPLKDEGVWRKVAYDGRGLVPVGQIGLPADGSWAWLSGHEISGEFLGEMGRTLKVFKAALGRVERRIAELATY